MSRFFKYINIVIVAACALFLGAVYRYVWSVLPATSGTVQSPVNATVKVVRDAGGVPHLHAANEEDLFFAQGYVTAQDRLFQLEFARRQAAGELAEVVGNAAIESDLESRRLRMRRLAERYARSLTDSDRAPIASYAQGVNHFIATHRDRLPVEFTMLGFDPRPWTITDSVLVGLQMFRSLTTTWRDELLKRNLLAGGDATKVGALFPSAAESPSGSNSWVVSGKHTKSGKPILASDPHLSFTLPCIWYQIHLQAPSIDVAGVSLPGLPGVSIGHNQSIAWGITSLQFDVQDLYREPAAAVIGQDLEVVRVKGGGKVEAQIPVTRHGPIFTAEGNQSWTLRWAAAETPFAFPFVELNHARNWEQFRKALSRHPGPGFNFLYADVEGNIGYQVAGSLPKRVGWSGDTPQDGIAAKEWDGFIPFDELPSSFNPPDGVLVNANENPFPKGYPYPVNGAFASHHRVRQIRDRLRSHEGWQPEEMLAIQKDVYSPFSHYLAQGIVAACKARGVSNPALTDAIALLDSWNGQMEIGQAAPMIATLAYQHVRKAIADRAAPGKGSLYDFSLAADAIESILRARRSEWFADFDAMLVKALDDAVAEGVKLQGGNVKRWDYGLYNTLLLKHPLLGDYSYVRWFTNIGPHSMGGSTTTVKQTSRRSGPSMRFVADLADFENSRMNLTTGQSGQILSNHYRDQWDDYYAGRSYRMQFQRVEGVATLELVPSKR
ncbi:MAG: penicillin acylase family protein [Bryobacteraceae bacterium]